MSDETLVRNHSRYELHEGNHDEFRMAVRQATSVILAFCTCELSECGEWETENLSVVLAKRHAVKMTAKMKSISWNVYQDGSLILILV